MGNFGNRRSVLALPLAMTAWFAIGERLVHAGPLTSVLSHLLSGNPLLALAELAETALSQSQPNPELVKLEGISNQLVALSSKQDQILTELAAQRIVMREELKRAFLDNDVREMNSLAQRFKIALALGARGRTASLEAIQGRADELSAKLGTYGLAATPAFLTAVALQNAVHFALKSPARAILILNQTHLATIRELLYAPGQNSLAFAISQNIPTPEDRKARETIDKHVIWVIPKEFNLCMVTIQYKNRRNLFGLKAFHRWDLIYTYHGFRNGEPILTRTEGWPTVGPIPMNVDMSEFESPKVLEHPTGSFSPYDIPELESPHGSPKKLQDLFKDDPDDIYFTRLDKERNPILLPRTQRTIQLQLDALIRFYKKHYSSAWGPNISSQSPKPYPPLTPTEAQKDFERMLVEGLDAVGKILAAARHAAMRR